MFSARATAVAVLLAFVAGCVITLAIRPPGERAAAAVASGGATVRQQWRMPLAASRNLPGSGETPIWLAETVHAATEGAFDIELFDPGEIVPAFAITDAVRDRKVQAGFVWLGYDQGKVPASALIAAAPFGMPPWAYIGWWYFGGGQQLTDAIYEKQNIKPLFCAISGPETAGWFREPIRSAADIEGLKIRFAGVGGKVMQRAGASITMLPAGEIFQALETGVIDATEYSQPITDRALGFSRIAKYNYFPGWHQPHSATHLVVNLDVWRAMSVGDQALLEGLCAGAVALNLGLTESMQGAVIADFPRLGVVASLLPDDLLERLRRETTIALDEEASEDADFAAVLASQRRFLATYQQWQRLAYLPVDAEPPATSAAGTP